jgi:diguanylate cyclase (GGDEF)-like protein
MQAYRAADIAQNKEQRVLAADALSSVMREIGDYNQALALNSEVVDWHRQRHESLALSVAQYLRGNIFMDMRVFAAAASAFAEARALSVTIGDTQGVAFSDMRICEVRTELEEYASARKACNSALATFTASQTMDVVKQTRSRLAQIDLAEGNTARALSTLNEILVDGAADMPPRNVAPLFALRARANAARGNYAAAYTDLDEYTKRYSAANETRRVRQIAGMRARFETDRQIDRNAGLQKELRLSKQREVELQRRTWIAIAAGALVIGLLTAMLFGARRHRRQLSALATLDALTQLPNRRHTADLATRAIANASETSTPLTLALIDLDHFKAINDEYGHAAGDLVLRDFARLTRDMLRETDTFGRWGGEEFLLLMPGTSLDLALAIVERLRSRALDIVLPGAKAGFKVSMSAGLAGTIATPSSLDELVALADAALYRAKHDGRNMVRIDALSVESASSGVRRAISRR